MKEEVFGPRGERQRSTDDPYAINVRIEEFPVFEGRLRYEKLSGRFSMKLERDLGQTIGTTLPNWPS